MAYVKNIWVDRSVSTPNNAVVTKSGGGTITSGDTITVVASAGTITQAGTPITAALLNNIENGIEAATNPSYSTTVVSTDSINTLPATSQGLIDEMLVKGRTITNILTDAVAGCESASGWISAGASGTAPTLSVDPTNKLEGTNCLKATLTDIDGQIYYNAFSLLTQGKYYLISANIKNGNASAGAYLGCRFIGDAIITGTTITSTSYTRVGIIVQPSDFDLATEARIRLYINGVATQYAYIDTLSLHEISATDYALGVPTLLNKYEWHLGTKSVDKMRVLSVGKNLLTGEQIANAIGNNTYAYITNVDGRRVLALLGGIVKNLTNFKFKENTQYSYTSTAKRLTISGGYVIFAYTDGTFSTAMSPNATDWQSLTRVSTLGKTIAYLQFSYGNGAINYYDLDTIQLEQSATATTYEPYQQTQSTCNLPLRAVPTITDTWDAIRGKHVKNVSDWVTLSGNAFTWVCGGDYVGSKQIRTSDTFTNAVAYSEKVIKYNGVNLTPTLSITSSADLSQIWTDSRLYFGVSDTDTGWDESWMSGTSFTGMTWALLIRAYMNGWKLTTANTNVASCTWTGIASGTTKTGASGYTNVTTTIDIGFTPYRMLYQLATPITTYLQPNVLSATANGTIYQENFVEDYGWFNSGLALTDTSKLITNLVEVRKWNLNDGSYTIIPNSSITLTTGVITAITGSVNGEFYTFDYNYDESLGLNGGLNYSYAVNMAGQVTENTNNLITLDKKVEEQVEFIPVLSSQINTNTANITLLNNGPEKVYIPGNTVILSLPTEKTGTSTFVPFDIVKSFKLGKVGTVRVKGEMKLVGGGTVAGISVYSPRLATSLIVYTSSATTYTAFSIDIPLTKGMIEAGETIQIGVGGGGSGSTGYIRNITICADIGEYTNTVITD